MGMIAVQDLVFEYPGARALHGLCFALPAGSITALVGPNGAGKTTLLRCLAALEEPFSGTLALDGADVQQDPRAAHRLVGYVPDDFGLYQELTVEQCLRYAGAARGMSEAELKPRLDAVLAQLGIESKRSAKAGSLSRGQRQRLAIAQAIIHRPRVLLLDEPASGLDPESRASLSGLMRGLAAEGMTLVVSSHILSELEEYCTAMLVLREGRVIEYRALHETQTTAATRRVRLALAQAPADWPQALQMQAGVSQVQASATGATLEFNGDDAALAALLTALVQQGLPVFECVLESATLQEAYLSAVHKARAAS